MFKKDDEIIIPGNDDRKSSKKDDKIIVPKNNDVKSSKKDDDDDEIIVPRNNNVKSSFLNDNESSFQETISFLLKQLKPARASLYEALILTVYV